MKHYGARLRQNIKRWLLQPVIPARLRSHFRDLDEGGMASIQASLKSNFYSNAAPDFLSSESGKKDFFDHLSGTLELNRGYIIPWLDSIKNLQGSKILELGCGTGASTVALAEQGADVTGLDIEESSLNVAKDRCEIYRLDVNIMQGNATEIRSLFSDGKFDFIIFYASLEHMTHEERMTALTDAWLLLPENGILAVIETPNRLWYFDSHTSGLPFYHWLPDDVALEYSRFSARRKFNELCVAPVEQSYVELMRWGRGVSYHEFELAIKGVNLSSGVTCSSDFVRKQRVFSRLKWRFSKGRRHQMLLRSLRPDIHSGFFQPYLNVSILKQ